MLLKNEKSTLFLLFSNWKRLIRIEHGRRTESTLKKSYPKSKRIGVPKSNKPVPKTDCTIPVKTITERIKKS